MVGETFAKQRVRRTEMALNMLLEEARQTPSLWQWPGFMPLACHLSDVVDDAAWGEFEQSGSSS